MEKTIKKNPRKKREANTAHSITAYNKFFETVDVWIYNAGLQMKTRHSYEYTNTRDILQYVLEGEGTLECEGKSYHLSPHTLFLLPKNVRVKYYSLPSNPYRYYWISFSGVYADILLKQSGLSPDTPTLFISSPAIKRSFKRIYDCLKKSQAENAADCSLQPKILSAFYEIFSVLLENQAYSTKKYSANELINRAVDMMNSEYSRGLSVTEICERLFLNRTYFSVLFKKHIGISPLDYLSNLRYTEACRLLKQTSMSVREIAEAVGMTSGAFLKLFKARQNKSPTAYRKEK